ncbi:MAG: hypothetical protein ACYC3S_13835 [Chloroflexota bacterium]
MSEMSKTLAAFVLPLAIGRLVEFVMGTPVGKNLAESVNNPSLASDEGKRVVRKYSSAAAAVAVGAVFTLGRRPQGTPGLRRDRAETIGLAAELLLSAGALAKVASDYIQDQRAVQRRHVFPA